MVKKFKINYTFKGGMNKNPNKNKKEEELAKEAEAQKREDEAKKKKLEEEAQKREKKAREKGERKMNEEERKRWIEWEEELEKQREKELEKQREKEWEKNWEKSMEEDWQEEARQRQIAYNTIINLRETYDRTYDEKTNNEIQFQRKIIEELKKNGVEIDDLIIYDLVKPELMYIGKYKKNDKSLDGLEDLLDFPIINRLKKNFDNQESRK